MQLFLGVLRLLWSRSPKNQAWWYVLIIPEPRRWRQEASLGYLVCSWPIEAFEGEAWTVPKESRLRLSCPLASTSDVYTYVQQHKHAQHICTISKTALSICACVLLWWTQGMLTTSASILGWLNTRPTFRLLSCTPGLELVFHGSYWVSCWEWVTA